MTETAKLLAPAKLNLGLRIPYRLPSGYHHLVSVFAAVSLADEMYVQPADVFSIHLQNCLPEPFAAGITPAFTCRADGSYDNILYRVWQVMREHTGGTIPPLTLTVVKNIPSPAGLGGGSSDAAALLKYLNQYACLSGERLASVALSLGADVPFFLQPGPALVSGVGEPLCRLHLRPFCGVIGVPAFGFSTREMFLALKKDLQPEKERESVLTEAFSAVRRAIDWLLVGDQVDAPFAFRQASTEDWRGVREIPNDFLGVVRELYPREAAILNEGLLAAGEILKSRCGVSRVGVGLTGSGSAIYAVTEGHLAGIGEAVAELKKSQGLFAWFQVVSL